MALINASQRDSFNRRSIELTQSDADYSQSLTGQGVKQVEESDRSNRHKLPSSCRIALAKITRVDSLTKSTSKSKRPHSGPISNGQPVSPTRVDHKELARTTARHLLPIWSCPSSQPQTAAPDSDTPTNGDDCRRTSKQNVDCLQLATFDCPNLPASAGFEENESISSLSQSSCEMFSSDSDSTSEDESDVPFYCPPSHVLQFGLLLDTKLLLKPTTVTSTYRMCFYALSGDITQKGYEKKRLRLLAPYITQAQQQSGK